MHPRQQSRTGHQRRFTTDETRRFERQPFASASTLKSASAPRCAFAVVGTVDVRIEVARGFAVHLPFADNLALAFPQGTVVDPLAVESWQGRDAIVIAAAPVGTSGTFRLVALPRRINDYDIVLGGFDLNASGAIFAGSFWDANLDDDCVDAGETTNPVARSIADIFVTRARNGFDDTTGTDLVREGISERDAMQHYEAGAALAAAELRDTDLSADRVTYDRRQRVMLGANAVAGLLLRDIGTVHTACRLAGLSTAELGTLFDDIVGEAMRLVREARAILVAVN